MVMTSLVRVQYQSDQPFSLYLAKGRLSRTRFYDLGQIRLCAKPPALVRLVLRVHNILHVAFIVEGGLKMSCRVRFTDDLHSHGQVGDVADLTVKVARTWLLAKAIQNAEFFSKTDLYEKGLAEDYM